LTDEAAMEIAWNEMMRTRPRVSDGA